MNHPAFYHMIFKCTFPKGIYVYRILWKMSINPEGIICKKGAILHIIPSGLGKILLNFPINIYSLRECAFEKIML
jgi:hypothetical protein